MVPSDCSKVFFLKNLSNLFHLLSTDLVSLDTGISIPYNYTAFLSPITTQKLYENIAAYKDDKKFEMPFVVQLRAFHEIGMFFISPSNMKGRRT